MSAWTLRCRRQIAKGLCVRCKEPHLAGKRLCQKHLDEQKAWNAKNCAETSASRHCKFCTAPVARRRKVCDVHAAEQGKRDNERVVGRKQVLRALGLCTRCRQGQKAAPGKAMCQKHLKANSKDVAASIARKTASGECLHCKEPRVDGKQFCRVHWDKRKQRTVAYWQKRKAKAHEQTQAAQASDSQEAQAVQARSSSSEQA